MSTRVSPGALSQSPSKKPLTLSVGARLADAFRATPRSLTTHGYRPALIFIMRCLHLDNRVARCEINYLNYLRLRLGATKTCRRLSPLEQDTSLKARPVERACFIHTGGLLGLYAQEGALAELVGSWK